MVNEDDLKWWLELVPTLDWWTASTMPDVPHSYVVRGKTLDYEDFIRAVRVIRTFGEPGKFYNSTNVYLTHEGIKWWTMGAPVEDTIIINKATTEKAYGRQDAPSTYSGIETIYDDLSTMYDHRYESESALEENEHIRKLIMGHFGTEAPVTLDAGCGTGLLLDMGITSSAIFTGVDPSQGMLNELIRKHPKVSKVYPSKFEDVVDIYEPRQFELVVSLFGSPSYMPPETIKKLPTLSSNLVVMMHYREGYLPDYYNDRPKPPYVDASREAALSLGGTSYSLNEFVVTVIHV